MYDRQRTIDYAHKWWDKRNPNYFNFDCLGGDCTNFVSQCLLSGGISMDNSTYGWYYNSLDSRSPSWTGVDEFYSYSVANQKQKGVRSKIVNYDELEIGDVIQVKLKNESGFQHAMLITKMLGRLSLDDIYVTCHSADAKDRRLSSYYIIELRCLKILN